MSDAAPKAESPTNSVASTASTLLDVLKSRAQGLESLRYFLALLSAFLLPLKLSVCYAPLLALIIIWLLTHGSRFWVTLKEMPVFLMPLLCFILSVSVCSLFGIAPLRSIKALPSLAFFALLIPAVRDIVRRHGPFALLTALALGQALAALHSVIFPYLDVNSVPDFMRQAVRRPFLGEVTESGQLALTIVASAGAFLSLRALQVNSLAQPLKWWHLMPTMLLSALNVLLVSFFAFNALHNTSHGLQLFFAILVFAALACPAWHSLRCLPGLFRISVDDHQVFIANARGRLIVLFSCVLMPLLVAAILVNLKRGPWVGVVIGMLILISLHWRRILLPLASLVLLSYFAFEPIRERLHESSAHFLIAGGRAEMWQIGAELLAKFPLGMGLGNSKFLHEYSASVPLEMSHFHNNFLNIAVETSLISLLIYLFWMVGVIKFGLWPRVDDLNYKPLARGIGCGLIAWQIAGLVEYNWGDAEVRLVALLLIGVLAGISVRDARCAEKT